MASQNVEPISTVEALAFSRKVEVQLERTKLVNPTDDALEAIRVLFECEEEISNAISNAPQNVNTVNTSAQEGVPAPTSSLYKNNFSAIFTSRKENASAAAEEEQKSGYTPK